jgi:hypothetical protein
MGGMFRLLQRMDDAEPRLPAGGEAVPARRPELRPLTVLAEADESELEALEDWARGLDWVQWLLSGVRQRMGHLHYVPDRSRTILVLRAGWERFGSGLLEETLAPHFHACWQAAQKSDLAALMEAEEAFSKGLSAEQGAASVEAGRLLLKATNRARYQGLLGHLRTACDSGATPGHFLTLWPVVAQFFQLSVTSTIAEYLRLEWGIATRHLPETPPMRGLPELTGRVMQRHVTELRVVE